MRSCTACSVSFVMMLKLFALSLSYGSTARLVERASTLRECATASLVLAMPVVPVDTSMTKRTHSRPISDALTGFARKMYVLAAMLTLMHRSHYPRLYDIVFNIFGSYLFISLTLDASAIIAELVAGVQCAPAFDTPHLAKDLKDFWNNRWNVPVVLMLRDFPMHPLRDYLHRKGFQKSTHSRFVLVVRFMQG